MTTPTSATPAPKPAYKPTAEQLARAAKLRRFNRLAIYTPLILAAIVVIGLVVLMVWQVVVTSPEAHLYDFLSGVADLILIINIVPMMLLCAIGPALFLLLANSANKRRQLAPELRRNKVQVLLWRVDRLLDTVQVKLRDIYLERVARPIVRGHAFGAAVRALATYLQRLVSSKD